MPGFPIATAGAGQCSAMPDVCLTPAPPAPPIPMSYFNVGHMLQVNRGTAAKKVTVQMMPVLTLGSQVAVTTGDESGIAGIVSNLIKGLATATKGSSKVLVEGKPAVYQTCTFAHNGVNANAPLGIHDVPSGVKVLVAP